jgi:hypothetical protein
MQIKLVLMSSLLVLTFASDDRKTLDLNTHAVESPTERKSLVGFSALRSRS